MFDPNKKGCPYDYSAGQVANRRSADENAGIIERLKWWWTKKKIFKKAKKSGEVIIKYNGEFYEVIPEIDYICPVRHSEVILSDTWNKDLGEGGYVYAEPGMYRDACLFDRDDLFPSLMDKPCRIDDVSCWSGSDFDGDLFCDERRIKNE